MRFHKCTVTLALLAAFTGCAPQGRDAQQEQSDARPDAAPSTAFSIVTPAAMREEHQEIHAILEKATTESGEVGAAAQELASVLGPHFRREEEIATPPLSLLVPLSQGPVTEEMRAVLPMTEALEREMPQMLAEHAKITAALERLEAAARAADLAEYISFSETLAHHARQEEEILYPAAILVGRYVAASDAIR